MIVMTFIARQVGRRKWGDHKSYLIKGSSSSAARLYRILSQCSTEDEIRRALGLFKWFFEAGENKRNPLQNLRKAYRIMSPSQLAPQGFADKYLRTVLGLS